MTPSRWRQLETSQSRSLARKSSPVLNTPPPDATHIRTGALSSASTFEEMRENCARSYFCSLISSHCLHNSSKLHAFARQKPRHRQASPQRRRCIRAWRTWLNLMCFLSSCKASILPPAVHPNQPTVSLERASLFLLHTPRHQRL